MALPTGGTITTIGGVYSTTLNDANLVSLYRLEGNANDSKGSNHGTGTDITYGTNYGKYEQGGDFDGDSSVITITKNASLNLSNTWTISYWASPATTNNLHCFFSNGIGDGGAGGVWGYHAGNIYVRTSADVYGVDAGLSTGWHMYTFTLGNNVLKAYKDGAYVRETAISGNYTAWGSSGSMYFGKLITTYYYYDGSADDVAIFNDVLSSTEITALYNASGYRLHTFKLADTGTNFTVDKSGNVSVLVVAGGGKGGTDCAGGGGGGGVVYNASFAVTAQAYTVTVGAGSSTTYQDGADSVFSTITADGGGYGGDGGNNGNTGGNGGGAGYVSGKLGGHTTGGGYDGGDSAGINYIGAGGGGAGHAGYPPAVSTAGAGGAGVANAITGVSVTYAGGGGGGAHVSNTAAGAGGAGGGGAGGKAAVGTAGTNDLGGGGGGGGNSQAGGNGGSGIVIIRYTASDFPVTTDWTTTKTDVVTVVDTILKNPRKVLSEVVAIVENFVANMIKLITLSEVVTIVDTFIKATRKVVADVVTIAETIKKQTGRIMGEVVTLVDTFTKQPNKIVGEVVTIAESFIRNMGKVATDVVTIAETIEKRTRRIFGDVVTIVDNFSQQRGKVFNEVITIVDGLTKNTGRVVSEVVTIAESFAQEVKKILILIETISITDSITKLFNYIGKLPSFISALISPKPVGISTEKDKPGIGISGSVTSPTAFSNDKDKPGIGVAHSVDKPERV